MRVFFRVDASSEIGMGHLMRCLTLSEALRVTGAKPVFISRELPGHLCDVPKSKGFEVRRLLKPAAPSPSRSRLRHASWLGTSPEQDLDETQTQMKDSEPGLDWLVVDHYALDKAWESPLRRRVRAILAIDDLADRNHDCDILLDQNLYDDMATRYGGRVPTACRMLLGPTYALVGKDYPRLRKQLPARIPAARRLLVFFGGADPLNHTSIALKAIQQLNRPSLAVDVVIGPSNPFREELEAECKSLAGIRVHTNVPNLAELMAQADLALGAGGISTWERCCLGLPAITTAIAYNQEAILIGAEKAGVLVRIDAKDFVPERVAAALADLLDHPAARAGISDRGMRLVDGNGAQRVAEQICKKELLK